MVPVFDDVAVVAVERLPERRLPLLFVGCGSDSTDG